MNLLSHTKFEIDNFGQTYTFLLKERPDPKAMFPCVLLKVDPVQITYFDSVNNVRGQFFSINEMFDFTDSLSVVQSLAAFNSDFLYFYEIEIDAASLPIVELIELPLDAFCES